MAQAQLGNDAFGVAHHVIGLDAYGVTVAIGATTAEVLRRIERRLPPNWDRRDPEEATERIALTTPDGTHYRVQWSDGSVSASSDLEVGLDVLERHLRAYIALHAPGLIFLHAGVVAHRGRAILIPGSSFSGKTTLVSELVKAGASYYSDEFAVLDEDGCVHPFAKPLAMRNGGLEQVNRDVEEFGGTAGTERSPVGLVVMTEYRPGAEWRPARVTAGAGVMGLMSHTIPAQERPKESLAALRNAVEGALVLEGERGEAAEIAKDLLARLAV